MLQAKIYNFDEFAGILTEADKLYNFTYDENYTGPSISVTMPKHKKVYSFRGFPPFFDGLLPEGSQLEALLKLAKLDRDDYLAQLITVGEDLVGSVTVMAMSNE